MPPPQDILGLLRAATRTMLRTCEGFGAQELGGPSRLPGWSVGHVMTHLARNADSHVRRLDAALEGRVVSQYEGGRVARDATIGSGATRPHDQVVQDLAGACARLEGAFDAFPPDLWDHAVVEVEQSPATASRLPLTRLVEVEVHHVDLGSGYLPAHWPDAFTERLLPAVLDRLARRGPESPGDSASWHLHRTDGEGEWIVARAAEGTVVATGHRRADCAVRGPGAAMAYWLMGRGSAQAWGLEVLGDPGLAEELPPLLRY